MGATFTTGNGFETNGKWAGDVVGRRGGLYLEDEVLPQQARTHVVAEQEGHEAVPPCDTSENETKNRAVKEPQGLARASVVIIHARVIAITTATTAIAAHETGARFPWMHARADEHVAFGGKNMRKC